MRCLVKTLVLPGLLTFLLPLATITAAEKTGEPVKAGQDEVKALQKERIQAFAQLVELRKMQHQRGAVLIHQLAAAQMKLLEAKLDAAETLEERIARLEELVAVAKNALEYAESRYRSGFNMTQADVLEEQGAYLEIKIRLARERAKLKPKKT